MDVNWRLLVGNLIKRVPIERVLFPPRDNIKALQDFAARWGVKGAETPVPSHREGPPEEKTTVIAQEAEGPSRQVDIATACVPCALGHFSTSTGLLNEAVRFKNPWKNSSRLPPIRRGTI